MEILTCIKQVPGTSEVEVDEQTGVLKRDGVDSKMNPYDLYALETALKIKEQTGAKLKVLTMGPPQASQIIKEAYMMGVDEGAILSDRKFAGADVLATSYTLSQGVRKVGKAQASQIIKEAYMMGVDEGAILSDRKFAGADVLATSYTLSQGVRKVGKADLIICGKQTTDGDTAQVGPEMAEFLNIPHVTNVTKIIDIKEHSIVLEVDMPTTREICEIKYPCLITVEKGIFQPRLPSYKLKIATSNKEVSMYSLNDFEDKNENNYGLNGSPTQVLKIFPPTHNTDKEVWSGETEEITKKFVNKLIDLKLI